jgi:hypothetical protein
MEEKLEKEKIDTESITPTTELPSEELQRGVKDVEAVTLSWSKKTLVAVFIKYVL